MQPIDPTGGCVPSGCRGAGGSPPYLCTSTTERSCHYPIVAACYPCPPAGGWCWAVCPEASVAPSPLPSLPPRAGAILAAPYPRTTGRGGVLACPSLKHPHPIARLTTCTRKSTDRCAAWPVTGALCGRTEVLAHRAAWQAQRVQSRHNRTAECPRHCIASWQRVQSDAREDSELFRKPISHHPPTGDLADENALWSKLPSPVKSQRIRNVRRRRRPKLGGGVREYDGNDTNTADSDSNSRMPPR